MITDQIRSTVYLIDPRMAELLTSSVL